MPPGSLPYGPTDRAKNSTGERTIVSGADFLQLDPGAVPRGQLTGWLVDALRAAITDGRLAVGVRLPASRVLAVDLEVSRGVVVAAYQRLYDEGLLRTDGPRGTAVASAPPAVAVPPVRNARPAPGVDLSPGVPDLSAFPRAAWLRAERAVLGSAAAADLGYGDPRGNPVLRRELAGWLGRTRGVRADAEDIIVVAGVAQALGLLAQVLAGERAGIEDPGSRGTREQLAHWGVEPVPVPVDADGLDVTALARSGVRVVLVTPAHHFPTGVVLAPGRRRELLDWAAAGGLVIEDDYDAEHRYDRAPVPALQGMAPDRVAHTGSVSKTLAPGLRIGWVVAPRALQPELVARKRMTDLGNAALPQLVLAQLIASGELERHLRRVRTRQRARRDAMLAALRHHLPDARIHGVAAGLHLLVTFPPGLDDRVLAERARDSGVLVQPLSWHRVADGPPGLVLGYAAHPPGRIHDAIARLGASWDHAPARGPRP
ncbi:PLP-dependent aminotransferase family protein [Pseudonocardia xinjiangensis]|uniref:PLP-dependent aminotransferase family protein n=1 Tax=Pseudonocardia xinjiangensis TaxID=75289 RepID=A0ABX1RRM6_9PSEU|nr:PLP-dependent aminotransferase family protein [Pseudonocardia xinjiangensis]